MRLCLMSRLRVVSNLGDSGKIHARAKMGSREETRHEEGRRKARLLTEAHFRARACISRESRKLETTRSLLMSRPRNKKCATTFAC